MSRSYLMMQFEFHMLDGRWQCVPEMKEWSAGHMRFKTGMMKLRTGGPASWTFDELDEPYDREKWIALVKEKLIEEFTLTGELDSLLGTLFDEAKKHCDEHHGDMRIREANGEWTRKGH